MTAARWGQIILKFLSRSDHKNTRQTKIEYGPDLFGRGFVSMVTSFVAVCRLDP